MSRDALRAVFLESLAAIAPEAPLDDLDPDDSLREQLDIDSMDLLRLARLLHQRLGVEIPELDYPKLDYLDDAVDYLVEHTGGAS
jgi:acyl carrier protein